MQKFVTTQTYLNSEIKKNQNNRKVDIFKIIIHIYLRTEKIELIKDNYSHDSDTVFNNLKKEGKISVEI